MRIFLNEKVSLDVNCGKEEILEELRICLPKWVTQEQVTDMIRGTCRNIVDNFYEHETKFYEQVSAVIPFTSRDGISLSIHEALFSKLEFIHCETEGKESCQSSQFHKLKSMSSSQKSSISPVKKEQKGKKVNQRRKEKLLLKKNLQVPSKPLSLNSSIKFLEMKLRRLKEAKEAVSAKSNRGMNCCLMSRDSTSLILQQSKNVGRLGLDYKYKL